MSRSDTGYRQGADGAYPRGAAGPGNGSVSAAPREHRKARGVIKFINSAITFIEVVVLLGMLAFGVYGIWDNRQIDSENTASVYEMYKPTAQDTRTYDDFRNINPDVCGWITINDTGIDYPLVQGEDNDEYMNTTPDLKFALSGSLFLDYSNSSDFSDFNTIIYGHHMEGPSMFGALDQYVDDTFFQDHEDGLLYYGGQWHELDVFAFLEVDAYDQQIYSFPDDEESRTAYLEYIKNNAQQYRDLGVTAGDHIIVMSTCMTDMTNGRYIAVAKIGGVTAGPQTQETGRKLSRDGLSPQMLNMIFAITGGLIIFLLILIYLWYRHRKRKKEEAKRKKLEEEERLLQSEGSALDKDISVNTNEGNAADAVGGSDPVMTHVDPLPDGTASAGMAGSGIAGESSQNDKRSENGDRSGSGGPGEEESAAKGRKGKKSKKADKSKKSGKKKKATLKDDLINLAIRIVVIAAVIWVVFSFIFGVFINSGVAMEPSVQDRDIVLFYRLDNEYTANEAVVYEAGGEERLGRIVARGGDTVEVTDEGLKVNGYLQQDYKNTGETLAAVGGTEYPVTLASDEFFILGDNREESTDSRMFGPVKLDDIKGSVLSVLRRRDV